MKKYKAPPFVVIIIWFDDNKLRKRKFNKYLEAVTWANENLGVDEITVRILGQLILEDNNAT